MKKVMPFAIMFILISGVLTVFFPTGMCETAEEIEWEQTFGEDDITEKGTVIIQTNDGGYFILADTIFHNGLGLQSDIWLIKIDNEGNIEWDNTFERADNFYTRSGKYVEQTLDNGYIVISEAHNYGYGEWPYLWLLKLDSNGNKQWDTTLSKTEFHAGKQLSDGGYLIAGEGVSSYLPRIFKIDQNGGTEWSEDYYFTSSVTSVWESINGKYLITSSDGKLIRLFNNGTIEWQKTVSDDNLKIESETSDGNYGLIGTKKITSGSGDYSIYMPPNDDIYFFKCDSDGNILLEKNIGHYDRNVYTLWNWSINADDLKLATYEPRFSLKDANEGGYLFLAKRWSYHPGMKETEYKSPLWVVKADDNGEEEWHATLEDVPVESVQQTSDGGYALVGMKSDDVWLMKITNSIQSENQPPTVEIISPSNDDTVLGIVTISGTAYDPEDSLQFVQVSIMVGGDWITVDGTTSWSYNWNTITYPEDGNISISARSYDGIDYSLYDSIKVTVNQSVEPETDSADEGKTPGFELIPVILAISLILLWTRKRRK